MVLEGGSTQATPVTRGFLFADLRGYTAFTEAHGDKRARELLDAYRRVVREVVGQFGGAEIKTEGDSFYVVFPSATAAVKCGIALVDAAGKANHDRPDLPINVGVGIHAGETAEGDEGYVGSAINVAARLGAAANAGEVLVSETVRGLTRTGGEVRYVSRGNRRFKGVSEPIAVFAATGPTITPATRIRPRPFGRSPVFVGGAITGAVLLVVVVVLLASRGNASSPTGSPGATSTAAGGAPSSSLPAGTTLSSPAPSSGLAEMPYGEPVPPAGKYQLSQFYQAPELESDGGWRLGTCDRRPPQGICLGIDTQDYNAHNADLHRADRPESRLVLYNPRFLMNDPCGNGPAETMRPEDSFLVWLRTQGALQLTKAVQRKFAFFEASQSDITVGPGGSPLPTGVETPCPFTEPDSVNIAPSGETQLFLRVGDSIRVYAIDVPSNTYAFMVAPNQQEFDLLEPPAEVLLNTLHFQKP